ncbi:phospholipid scramblase 1-like [Tribolium madens]|uniref:phospholipid scramblase 1-like n=1 Tax=Tribolium madens TaxID=41895 RepID=UPI001CF7653C|nr:phospholipid scramblase 1-like [Tribolium madens]
MANLDQLARVDQLIMRMEDQSSETRYKIIVENSAGQKLFYPGKVSGRFSRNIYLSFQAFNLKILDNFKNEVIHLHRPALCSSLSCGLFLDLYILAPPDTFVGKIEEKCRLCGPKFGIKDASGKKLFTIKGPFCICCPKNIEFKILSADGKTQVGIISKQAHTKCLRISFPKDMDVRMKAVMVGACFLILAAFSNVNIDRLWQYHYS